VRQQGPAVTVSGASYAPIMNDILVAGEHAETLLEALHEIRWSTLPNGAMSGTVHLEPRLGDPFARALMRVQAELLLHDADTYPQEEADVRTHEQRAADALVALALRVSDALGRPS